MTGREGFRGATQNPECVHDSQWETAFFSQPIRRPKTVPEGGAGQVLVFDTIFYICLIFALSNLDSFLKCSAVTSTVWGVNVAMVASRTAVGTLPATSDFADFGEFLRSVER